MFVPLEVWNHLLLLINAFLKHILFTIIIAILYFLFEKFSFFSIYYTAIFQHILASYHHNNIV